MYKYLKAIGLNRKFAGFMKKSALF